MTTTSGMTAYWAVVAFIFGSVFGSFIGCLADRHVTGEPIWKGRSHCDACGHPLSGMDLVPIFSYLFLGGRCRYCGQKIGARDFFVELFMGLAFAIITVRFGITFTTLKILGLTCILTAISLVDLQTFTIPDSYIAAGIIWWLVTVPLTLGFSIRSILYTVLGAVIVGGGMLLLSFIFEKVTGKDGLGGGDIKLFFMTGLYVGLSNILLEVIAACIIGLIMVAASGQKKIPFGPAISVATLFCILAGGPIVTAYLGLF